MFCTQKWDGLQSKSFFVPKYDPKQSHNKLQVVWLNLDPCPVMSQDLDQLVKDLAPNELGLSKSFQWRFSNKNQVVLPNG
jgi:hypothetical protein